MTADWLRISDWSADVCSSDFSRPPAVFLAQQAEVLRMGVGVADDDVEDGGIDQLQHLKRRTCCRLAQQREAVPKHRPAFSRIFAVRWNTKRLRKILMMQPPDFAIRCHTIVDRKSTRLKSSH